MGVFESVESGAAYTFPCQAGDIKKGMYVMLKREPCKVVEVYTSKNGKHGHAKAAFVGIHIFNGKKIEDACPTSHNMDVPVVTRTECVLSMVNELTGSVSVITDSYELKNDLNLPTVVTSGEPTEEDVVLAGKIVKAFNAGQMVTIVVLAACGSEKIVGFKITD